MTTRKALKFLHTMGSIGLAGALATQLVLLAQLPEPSALAEYAALRNAVEAVSEWILLSSLGITLVSGLFSMAMTRAYQQAGWAWLKLALGVSMFEGTLITVQAPAQREAALVAEVLAGSADLGALGAELNAEWNCTWVVLTIAVVNVLVGVWRPKFIRRRDARRA
jgi:hypothetical protein